MQDPQCYAKLLALCGTSVLSATPKQGFQALTQTCDNKTMW